MASRDRSGKSVTCPNCGQQGTINYSDDDYPFMRSLDRTIDEIEGDFKARIEKETQIVVTCNKCETEFK